MTDFAKLLAGGESEEAAVVPGQPAASRLIGVITPQDGKAEMPQGKPPLSDAERTTITNWIVQGAKDDTPANARERYDIDHPPVYSRSPIITSVDYSPDGSLLAMAGFHEVLLHKADGSGLVARLIGMSERIESIAFSPDGNRLVVAAGNPGRMGELQIWAKVSPDEQGPSTEAAAPAATAADWRLQLSIPITADTLFGASWSPDGKLVAVGCTDTIVRGFNAESGEQVFFNGAHDDWPLKTVFSVDGSHILSVGRDMSTKLYMVDTQRFVDNVTSITPGALKGGISALTRHPTRDEVLVGGSDGVPRIYRMHRVTKRVIGDDANLIRRYPEMRGRIYGAAYSPDGNRIAISSALDGRGQIFICKSDFDPAMPKEIQDIVQKTTPSQSAEEKAKLEAWITEGAVTIQTIDLDTPVYSISWSPDGSTIAAAGGDGQIRLMNPDDGGIRGDFAAVTVDPDAPRKGGAVLAAGPLGIPEDVDQTVIDEPQPARGVPSMLVINPPQVDLQGPGAYAQIDVTAWYTENDGETWDVTRRAELSIEQGAEVASVNSSGRIVATGDGEAVLKATLGDQTARVKINVSGFHGERTVNFVRDVNPVLARLGCNQGTCHGAKDGKNGFKLSLRGYDPIYDVRAFTDELKSRRTNIASPDDSLMLLKASGAVPHVGGQLTKPGHPYYEAIREWIADGAKLELDVPRVASIVVKPTNPIINQINGRQQLQVYATYTDGVVRDVTREAFLESGNTEAAVVNRAAIVTGIRRGESPIMARFEGQYAATTVTVMGDREGFAEDWQEPEAWSDIDQLVIQKWKRMKIVPSELAGDTDFVRRAYLDLTGLPPTADEVRAFIADERPTRVKRDELIDRLIASDAYTDYWTNKWADLLQVNRKYLGPEGAKLFRQWIREQVAANRPYDEFCYEILTATGSNKEHPAASYYKVLREPAEMMENTTHLFLAIRFNCNKCHDHPFERWNQDQYYETAAFFARVGLDRDPNNKDGNIGGTAVEGAKPLWEVVSDRPAGEVTHDRTGDVTQPLVPFDREIEVKADATRREHLATWITAAENDYFARSYVNRMWGYLMGRGLIEPIDDIRAGNPASNPELLDLLTKKFIESNFDVRELVRTICKSRVYQLSIATNRWNADDELNYSHALPKRLPAEVLYDTVYSVTGAKMNIPGVPAGTRAAALPDVGVELSDNFLANLGRPVRESACECERSSELQLGPVMALMNGPTVSEAISQGGNAIAELVKQNDDDRAVAAELFMRILNRPATEAELQAALSLRSELQQQHAELQATLAAYRDQIAPAVTEREAKRQRLIDVAKAAHDAYAEEIRQREEAAEQERQAKIAAAKAAFAEREASVVAKVPAWAEAAATSETGWTPLTALELSSTTGSKLAQEADLAVFATGPNDKQGHYQFTSEVDLKGITGIRLEVLADDRLPSKGPGRPPNGNFVLSEFSIEAWAKGQPDGKRPVPLQNARADFSQEGYAVETAIDGQAPPVAMAGRRTPRLARTAPRRSNWSSH
ncbi:MAG: DUF1549 domain-containing protein [Planctomycetaceae bacterium]